MVDFAFDVVLRGDFFATHVVAVAVAVAGYFVTFVSQALEAAPVGIPVDDQTEGCLVAVLFEHRPGIVHMTRSAVVERERGCTLAEA